MHAASLTDVVWKNLTIAIAAGAINGLGMLFLATRNPKRAYIPFYGLILSQALFPGLIIYGNLTNDKWFAKFVPKGGMTMILTWALMGFF